MNISSLQANLATGPADAQNSAAGPGPEQAAKNREILKAIRAINANETLGPGSELRFSVDRDTGRPLIRVVDRATNEVLNQIPPEDILHMMTVLEELDRHTKLA